MNRLGSAISPYLQQHAQNPVDWWPWCPEAFDEARRRDVPVLISVGYAACHWCHVMAHESFEDASTAAVVNEEVVAIKVDREERPDIDTVYMTATQALTGQGGWPMTVFATPEGEPFVCGTYYPRPAFVNLVRAVGRAWREQREQLLGHGQVVVEAISRVQQRSTTADLDALTGELLDAAAANLHKQHDDIYGGFSGAPKFPPHLAMLFLLRHHQRSGDPRSLELVRHTAEAMARGGIYDQLAGGFARYSVDERWVVPHFEKMLYDNALLLRVYTMLWRLTGDAMAARVSRETAQFLLSLRGTDRGFISSLDADAGGVEGATYAWTPRQLVAELGKGDGEFAADLFGVTDEGTFEHGLSVLRLSRDTDQAPESVRARWQAVRTKLARARLARPQPARDEKIISAWSAWAITALVEFGQAVRAMAGPDPAASAAGDAALAAAEQLRGRHLIDGRLRRASRDGVAGEPVGVLDDYGAVAEAFCAVHEMTGDGGWLTLAGALLDTALAHFSDGSGGFFDTADDAERLVIRPADPTDNATPSGLSSIASALLRYSALTGQPRYREAAQAALASVAGLIALHSRFAGYAAATAEVLLSGPYEIAVCDTNADSELARTAWRLAPPGAVIVVGAPDAPGVPLLRGRPLVGGQPTAYVCRGFVCDLPVTGVAELTRLISASI